MKLMVIHGQYKPAELELRRKPVLAAASPGTQIEFTEIKGDIIKLSYKGTGELTAMLAGPQIVEKAKEAQEREFDAVLPWGTLDYGVNAARCHVDIPVVPMGRASFCLAAMLATRIAVIVYESQKIPDCRRFIREIGFQDFVTSVRAVEIPTRDMAAQRSLLKERLIRLGRRAVEEEDAEVILPRGVTMMPVYCSPEEISSEVGVPVIDPIAAGVKVAEMLVSMGLRNSRKAYPAPL